MKSLKNKIFILSFIFLVSKASLSYSISIEQENDASWMKDNDGSRLEMNCKSPRRGPPGPTGPCCPGPTGATGGGSYRGNRLNRGNWCNGPDRINRSNRPNRPNG